jgi:hypothetical protein
MGENETTTPCPFIIPTGSVVVACGSVVASRFLFFVLPVPRCRMFVRNASYARRIRRGTPTGGAGANHFVTRNLSASPDDERSVSIGGDDGEVEARTPWKTLLEMPARASWRVSTAHLPQPLADAQDNL